MIGITGYPGEVRKFSKLVRVTAVLLIEQVKNDLETQNRRLEQQKFYHELTHKKTEYDNEFLQKAKDYGLDLVKRCQTVLVVGNINSKGFKVLREQFSHHCDLEHDKTVFFITSSYSYSILVEKLKGSNEIRKIAISS